MKAVAIILMSIGFFVLIQDAQAITSVQAWAGDLIGGQIAHPIHISRLKVFLPSIGVIGEDEVVRIANEIDQADGDKDNIIWFHAFAENEHIKTLLDFNQ